MHITCTIGRNVGPSRPSNTGSEGNPLLLRDPMAKVGEVKNREGRTKFGACIFCVLANGVRQLSVECEIKINGPVERKAECYLYLRLAQTMVLGICIKFWILKVCKAIEY